MLASFLNDLERWKPPISPAPPASLASGCHCPGFMFCSRASSTEAFPPCRCQATFSHYPVPSDLPNLQQFCHQTVQPQSPRWEWLIAKEKRARNNLSCVTKLSLEAWSPEAPASLLLCVLVSYYINMSPFPWSHPAAYICAKFTPAPH